jgi:heat shock protein HslJ
MKSTVTLLGWLGLCLASLSNCTKKAALSASKNAAPLVATTAVPEAKAERGPTRPVLLPESAQWQTKRQQGIDFVAGGITPADWTMDIDFSKQILFKPVSGSTLVAVMPKPQPMGKNSGVLLDTRTGSGLVASSTRRRTYPSAASRLKVFIEPVMARDNLTGRAYAYTVRVENAGRRYVGYGSFIRGSERLDGIWTLETFKGQRLRPTQFPNNQLPELTITVGENKVEGTTGCNKLKGEIMADGDHVQFTVRNTTNRKCTNPFEELYVEALQTASLFRIGKNRLTLLANGQYVMTLVKTGEAKTVQQ